LLGFGALRPAQKKPEGKRRGGHTWWILVAGKGLAEDVKSGAAARPVAAAAAAREGRPREAESERREREGRNREALKPLLGGGLSRAELERACNLNLEHPGA